ncbi:hypothetical protein D9756_007135 [Leucocoprinus leucothites]|uniref:SET domain-containing protein n=1 Tax=Leucocoprinus leucothites TaxID=201217 RepID=A0A8H5D659_9AGAR|nr:hypothetical protein D9756_007135 [Leucoagaricus leucothites]
MWVSDFDRDEIWTRLFENSPSPTPPEEQGTADELWGYEVVSEEVTYDGKIKHEIDWDSWKRSDGTTQTWHELSPAALRDWERIQNRRRREVVKDSIDIELSGLAGTDIHNFATCLRAQAYDEKLKTRTNYNPPLEDQMHDLLDEKLSPDWSPGSHSSLLMKNRSYISAAQRRRGLRQSTIRSHESSEAKEPTLPTSTTVQPPQAKLSNEWTKVARAAGAAPISFINEVDSEEGPKLAPGFKYIEKGHGNKAFAYSDSGLFAFRTSRGTEVLECNEACSCKADCINRVAQRPRDVPLEIFKTHGKGWGVRASVDIVRGKVIGMYTGLITREEASNNPEACYIFDLDGQENPEDDQDGGARGMFSVDAETCGNWTRFINHSCGPNIAVYLAVYDTIPSTNQPYITFVAREAVKAGTELTLDYDPGHADNPPHEDSEGIVKECFCGSDKCRRWDIFV